jgi:hypothetical protein
MARVPLARNESLMRSGHLRPFPIAIPKRLIEAFHRLQVEPILVGGSAVQVWTGEREGLFATLDLDFIAPLDISDLARAGIQLERSGRHAEVDGVVIEFPSGPLAVGDLILDSIYSTTKVPTEDRNQIVCIRPEPCVLDRLAWVASGDAIQAYPQAMAVAVAQMDSEGWDEFWMDSNAPKAGLSKLWKHLRAEIQSGDLKPDALDLVLRMGWD